MQKKEITMKTETTEQFFAAIKIPPTWRYIGRNDINVGEGNYWNNFGFVYQTPDNKMMRLFFTPKAGVGGFVEKDLKTEKYRWCPAFRGRQFPTGSGGGFLRASRVLFV